MFRWKSTARLSRAATARPLRSGTMTTRLWRLKSCRSLTISHQTPVYTRPRAPWLPATLLRSRTQSSWRRTASTWNSTGRSRTSVSTPLSASGRTRWAHSLLVRSRVKKNVSRMPMASQPRSQHQKVGAPYRMHCHAYRFFRRTATQHPLLTMRRSQSLCRRHMMRARMQARSKIPKRPTSWRARMVLDWH